MFRLVTVSREYGSGGAAIAQRLARRLEWKLLDRCLIEKIAKTAEVDPGVAARYDERLDPWFDRLAKVFAQLAGYYPGPAREGFDADVMASLTRHVIEEAASLGKCVIVGRGSQCILQQRSDTYHVFVYAPRGERLERIVARHPDSTTAQAAEIMNLRDSERATYVRRYFGQDWSNRHLYNLMICSSAGEEASTSTILKAMEAAREDFAAAG
jgi:cytidylate kinase